MFSAQNPKIPRMGVDFPAPNVFIERRLGAGPAEGPSSFGISAEPGYQEHRGPKTSVATEASGWRSMCR